MDYYSKYIKYKLKYLKLSEEIMAGGMKRPHEDHTQETGTPQPPGTPPGTPPA